MAVYREQHSKMGARTIQRILNNPAAIQEIPYEVRTAMAYRAGTAKWTPDERVVYSAVQDGFTSMDTLPVATGLKEEQVSAALASLTARGYISGVDGFDVVKSPSLY